MPENCPDCRGRGIVDLLLNTVDCEPCRGTGKKNPQPQPEEIPGAAFKPEITFDVGACELPTAVDATAEFDLRRLGPHSWEIDLHALPIGYLLGRLIPDTAKIQVHAHPDDIAIALVLVGRRPGWMSLSDWRTPRGKVQMWPVGEPDPREPDHNERALPACASSNTVSGRLREVQMLISRGLLDPDQVRGLLDTPDPKRMQGDERAADRKLDAAGDCFGPEDYLAFGPTRPARRPPEPPNERRRACEAEFAPENIAKLQEHRVGWGCWEVSTYAYDEHLPIDPVVVTAKVFDRKTGNTLLTETLAARRVAAMLDVLWLFLRKRVEPWQQPIMMLRGNHTVFRVWLPPGCRLAVEADNTKFSVCEVTNRADGETVRTFGLDLHTQETVWLHLQAIGHRLADIDMNPCDADAAAIVLRAHRWRPSWMHLANREYVAPGTIEVVAR
jgi:hypothetical protein